MQKVYFFFNMIYGHPIIHIKQYIEENITEDLTVSQIAREVNISAFYFQKGFSVLCGYTVGEYIRMRGGDPILYQHLF